MEAAAAARGGGGSMPAMTQAAQSRKQWRAVTEHRNEELDRSKLGHSDDRIIYELQQGREPVDVDFSSIYLDGNLDHDLLQQRLHDVARRREELQHMEIGMRAQMIASSEILEIHNSADAQIKEHASAASKLQEQLHEKDQVIHDLERKLEEKDGELHATKLDNEVVWAKEGLLREQNKELATFRRERDHSDAERAQHIQQLHDLQEHVQEKERQLIDLQEQHRLAQEAIVYKDEQLNEAQSWIARVQEMDVLQSSTLQNQLREHTEHYNQLWLGCQRQFAEMERHHMHTVQQLQFELADARQRTGTYSDESHVANLTSKDASQFDMNNGNQIDVNMSNGNAGSLPNGNRDEVSSFPSTVNESTQVNHVPSVPIGPSSLLGMPPFLPPEQVAGIHSFVLHQPGVPHSMPPQIPQSHVGNFFPIPAVSSVQQWQNEQASSESLQIARQTEPLTSPNEQNLMRSDAKHNYENSVNGQPFPQDHLEVQTQQGSEPEPVISSSPVEIQVESINNSYGVSPQTEPSVQKISSQFTDSFRLDSLNKTSDAKAHEQNVQNTTDCGLNGQVLMAEKPNSTIDSSKSDIIMNNTSSTGLPASFVSTRRTGAPLVGRTLEAALLDERSLLACMVRTIPAGGKIRISSTLPNRLGKMLAPLHWSDYKKKYGKLDDFVAAHTELFVIEGDFIQLRKGAQEMIAATAAVARVAAAAASSPYSAILHSVAVTPVAQNPRLKKSENQSQQLNGVSYGVPGGISNVSESKALNGSESTPGQSSVLLNSGSGALLDRSVANGRPSSNFGGKQHGRVTNSAFTSNRR